MANDALQDSDLTGTNTRLSNYQLENNLYKQKQSVEQERVAHDQALISALNDPAKYKNTVSGLGLNPSLDPSEEEKALLNNYNPSVTQKIKDSNVNNFNHLKQNLINSSTGALRVASDRMTMVQDLMKNNQAMDHEQNQTRERLIYIQNDSSLEKQNTIQRLSVLVYLLIYALGLGIAMAVGLISPRALGYATLVGSLVALFFAITTGNVLKTYGELSEKIVKTVVKDVTQEMGMTCPQKCRPKQLPPPAPPAPPAPGSSSYEEDNNMGNEITHARDDKRFYQQTFLRSRLNLTPAN